LVELGGLVGFDGLAESAGRVGSSGLVESGGLVDSVALAPSGALAEAADLVESADPAELPDPAESTRPAGPDDHAGRVGEEAASLAVGRLSGDVDAELGGTCHEFGEYLARRRRREAVTSSAGLCFCQDGSSGADRPPQLLAVEARLCDPLEVKRQMSRTRLGAILGHCRCEPGAVAA
jgi:hypothetical protein